MWKPRGKLQFCILTLALVLLVFQLYNMVVAHYPKVSNSFKDFKLSSMSRFSNGIATNSRGWLDRIQKFASGKQAEEVTVERNKNALPDWGRYVHLDLKGAPPKPDYLVELFPLLRRLKATGLLVEYEDMFPYALAQSVSSLAPYTLPDIDRLLAAAKANRLDVIPLIQTFGHMEFVLKLKEYKHLRESDRYPQSVCPSHPESLPLIYSMIDEIMSKHIEAKHIHLGCDEVFTLGVCPRCIARMRQNGWSKKQLFLDHVSTVARYVRLKYPNTTPLIWDDELRDVKMEELEGLKGLVQPVVWKYTTDVGRKLPLEMWQHYSAAFDKVWVASAFKGADQPNSVTTLNSYYYENHESWVKLVRNIQSEVHFSGIMLTGWQRYDHFAVLCELLPVAIPSLALNLAYLSAPTYSYRMLGELITKRLGCDNDPLGGSAKCTFPGAQVFLVVSALPSLLYRVSLIKEEPTYKGWLSNYNIDNTFSSPMQVEETIAEVERLRSEIYSLERRLSDAMQEVYDNNTISEWFYTNIKPTKDELERLSRGSRSILDKSEWPRRPVHLDL